jgi:hypothetical protein
LKQGEFIKLVIFVVDDRIPRHTWVSCKPLVDFLATWALRQIGTNIVERDLPVLGRQKPNRVSTPAG